MWNHMGHFAVGVGFSTLLLMDLNPLSGMFLGSLVGLYREQGQMAVTGDLRFGHNRLTDLIGHAIGGAMGGTLFWLVL